LSYNGTGIPEVGIPPIHKESDPKSATITVTNFENYEDIYWYCKSTNQLTETDGVDPYYELKADTANHLFENAGLYMITVVGKATEDQKYYGTVFNIKVES